MYLQEEVTSNKCTTRMLTKVSYQVPCPHFKKGHSKYTACILFYARFLNAENQGANLHYLSSPMATRVMALDLWEIRVRNTGHEVVKKNWNSN